MKCSNCKYWRMGIPIGRCQHPDVGFLPTSNEMVFERVSLECPLMRNRERKIGELNMKCGDCGLIDHCGEPWSEVAICCETRFENVDEELLYELLKSSQGANKRDRLDNAYNRLHKKN